MKRRALIPLLMAPLVYALFRAAAVARVRRFESLDADTVDLPGVRLYLRGRRIHLTLDGRGPPLLMLHGFGSSGADVRRFSPYLRTSMTVIAPDLPGWGYSERSPRADHSHAAQAALMLELLDRLSIGKAMVFGHGAGAAIALSMARAAPERVIALLLSNAPGFDPALPSWLRALLVPIVPLLVETRQGQRLIQRAVHVPGQRSNEQLVTTHLDEARVAGHAATFLATLTRRERDSKLDCRSVHVPTRFISDQESPEIMAAAIAGFVLQRQGVATARATGRPTLGLNQRGANRP